MANKANRYALQEMRERLVRLHGKHPSDVAHLVPLPQYRRERTEFERQVEDGLKATRKVNAGLPRHKKFTTKVKRVRGYLRDLVRHLSRDETVGTVAA